MSILLHKLLSNIAMDECTNDHTNSTRNPKIRNIAIYSINRKFSECENNDCISRQIISQLSSYAG